MVLAVVKRSATTCSLPPSAHMHLAHSEDIVLRLGRRLKQLRLQRNWTQTYTSIHMGMDRSHLSDLERGTREVGLRLLEVLAIGFGLTIEELLRDI